MAILRSRRPTGGGLRLAGGGVGGLRGRRWPTGGGGAVLGRGAAGAAQELLRRAHGVLLRPAKLADWRLPAALADWRLLATLDWRWPMADGGGGGRRLWEKARRGRRAACATATAGRRGSGVTATEEGMTSGWVEGIRGTRVWGGE
jgi:hypothetical protein